MDLRQWFLLNDLPKASDLLAQTKHTPCTEFRSPNVLRLFAAGYRAGFKLTDAEGQPTEALRLMVSMMTHVELCTGADLPDEEKRALGIGSGDLVDVLVRTWYLRGITQRIKAVFSSLNSWQHQWVWSFLPGLDGSRVTYKDADGKRRRRVCYLARCRPDWELTDSVYEGLWRWNYDHGFWRAGWWRASKCPDAYSMLGKDPSLRLSGGQGDGESGAEAGGAAS